MNTQGVMEIFEQELDDRLDKLVVCLDEQSEDDFIRIAILKMTVRDLVHKLSDTFADASERWALDEQLEVMHGVPSEKVKEI